jgi:hypothetical protein
MGLVQEAINSMLVDTPQYLFRSIHFTMVSV